MYVYLDIDGVMIPDGSAKDVIPADKADRLRRLIDHTGAKIVLSTHRRRNAAAVLSMLFDAGFAASDIAPDAATPLYLDHMDDDLSIRGQEIAAHIHRHQPRRFVILDDCPVLDCQAHALVLCDPVSGLTDRDLRRAIHILQVAA